MTLGSHQKTVGASQEHFTPKWIIDALGRFDLDPAGAFPRPWHCADQTFTRDGLSRPWFGRVWLNPPFDRYQVGEWISRLAEHGDGIALLHARTETAWFEPCWAMADAILFLDRRISFCRVDGSEQSANSGAPPVLVAFGGNNVVAIKQSGIGGSLVTGWVQLKGGE
jgi:hypothetical protein